MKKFELVRKNKINFQGRTLYRIKACMNFTTITGEEVKIGDLGGYIEKESNLSHGGKAWVSNDALVYEDAMVYGNAEVCGDAKIYGNAEVYGDTQVCDDARVYDGALVCDNAQVYGDAKIYGNTEVYGDAKICGNARIYGNALICENAEVCENAEIYGNAWVCGNAHIFRADNLLVVGPIGSKQAFVTFFNEKDGEVSVRYGCFYGKLSAFLKKVSETCGENKHANAYIAAAHLAEIQVELGKREIPELEKPCES